MAFDLAELSRQIVQTWSRILAVGAAVDSVQLRMTWWIPCCRLHGSQRHA